MIEEKLDPFPVCGQNAPHSDLMDGINFCHDSRGPDCYYSRLLPNGRKLECLYEKEHLEG